MIAVGGFAAAAVGLLLFSEWSGWRAGVWVAKPAASSAIVGFALLGGALGSTYGLWVLAALVLSLAGDVLLIPRTRRTFAFGLLAFLVAHLAYAVAFLDRGVDGGVVLGAVVVVGAGAVAVSGWLRPHVAGPFAWAVAAYILAIGAMVVLAAGAAAHDAAPALLAGATLFCVSDLAVARERFVRSGFVNKAWGLPLYFLGQGVLAGSVG